jgi:hypothetical protein
MAWDVDVIWGWREGLYFGADDWTGQITLSELRKFASYDGRLRHRTIGPWAWSKMSSELPALDRDPAPDTSIGSIECAGAVISGQLSDRG